MMFTRHLSIGLTALFGAEIVAGQTSCTTTYTPAPSSAGRVCGVQGKVSSPAIISTAKAATQALCVKACQTNTKCLSFSYDTQKNCVQYSKALANQKFQAGKSSVTFWARACYTAKCVCPTGQTNCGGFCVNLSSDPNNCGACNKICAGACKAGQCVGNCRNPITCSPDLDDVTPYQCTDDNVDCYCLDGDNSQDYGYCVAGSVECPDLRDCQISADCGTGSVCSVRSCCFSKKCIPQVDSQCPNPGFVTNVFSASKVKSAKKAKVVKGFLGPVPR